MVLGLICRAGLGLRARTVPGGALRTERARACVCFRLLRSFSALRRIAFQGKVSGYLKDGGCINTSSRFDCCCRLELSVEAPVSLWVVCEGEACDVSECGRGILEELLKDCSLFCPFGVPLIVPADAMVRTRREGRR